eukprot:TRINITY_DN46739_c0_g1_i1.p1 TRINITY_DN46739_c0_g1~~TRINITY_DN46739_c0_g1_i1.p1  ORF type:complete len:442 (+),score=-18.92 TRINITY_DN46739_c0_g1_i1:425-1750(+)
MVSPQAFLAPQTAAMASHAPLKCATQGLARSGPSGRPAQRAASFPSLPSRNHGRPSSLATCTATNASTSLRARRSAQATATATAGPFNEFLGTRLRSARSAPRACRPGVTRSAGPVRASLAEGQGMHDVTTGVSVTTSVSVQEWLDAFVRFTRPHTMIGTAISITSVSLLAVNSTSELTSRFVLGLFQALIPALLMNIYIVGLNQLFDIEIDKVNKPYLPLASGDFSVRTGVTIVATCAVLSLGLGVLSGSLPLLATLAVSMALGTAYSIDLPFLRWKRFPVLAASCILAVRAVVVQLGFFAHMQAAVLGQSLTLSQPLAFATAFMCTFSIVIALFKDIPDVEGDRVFGIKSLSVRVGQKKVYWFCVSILMASYVAATCLALTSSILWSKALSVITHVGAAIALWRVASSADLSSQKDITAVYMFVWKLFYTEYLFLPLMR